jgi:hypothetical protein
MRIPKILLVIGACACLLLTLPAAAQWGWKEKNGSRVYSDQQPPIGVADKDIFKRPAGSRAAPAPTPATDAATTSALAAPADSAASAPKPAASAPKLSGKDAELEKKKKEAEAAETAKKKAAEHDTAQARADNCDRAKKGLITFNSGVRMATTNDKGEREIMSDTQRAAETKRMQDIVAQDCK